MDGRGVRSAAFSNTRPSSIDMRAAAATAFLAQPMALRTETAGRIVRERAR